MGRPREFDLDTALNQALHVFWRNGYEGTSIADLTEAMGISPPSLYAAFGNKEKLFRKALDRYVAQHVVYWNEALAAPTARETIEHLLRESVRFLSDEKNPPGCLMVRSAVLCSEAAEKIQRDLTKRRDEGEALLRKRLEAAKRGREVPKDFQPADYARFIMTVLEGMAVRAASGATREELQKIADTTLRTWPA
jgi:AcrR family transcriptional regulator